MWLRETALSPAEQSDAANLWETGGVVFIYDGETGPQV